MTEKFRYGPLVWNHIDDDDELLELTESIQKALPENAKVYFNPDEYFIKDEPYPFERVDYLFYDN